MLTCIGEMTLKEDAIFFLERMYMDNSISKALIMVAGVLLAMIVIAFITHSFMQMGNWASVKEDETLIKQREEFNKEFEVYDKDLMYGVDLISCLNKAKNNNEKIEGNRSEKVDKSYKVDVEFTINTPLTESIIVYYINPQTQKETERTDAPTIPTNRYKRILRYIFYPSEKARDLSDELDWDTLIQTLRGKKTIVDAGTYTLTHDGYSASVHPVIEALLECTDEVKRTVKNTDSEATSEDSWTKATWETAAYDLKTRKFKCDGIEYNPDTGRVNKIIFKEF